MESEPGLAALAQALHEALPGRDLTCDLSDALGHGETPDQGGALPPGFRPLHPGRPFAGLAVTAQPQGTELGAVYAALDLAPAGSVLVVAGPATHAFWGERTTRAALDRGVRAAVLAGACRDVTTWASRSCVPASRRWPAGAARAARCRCRCAWGA